MSARVLSGRELAAAVRAEVADRVAGLVAAGRPVVLGVVVATDDPAVGWYVRSLSAAAGRVGVTCEVVDVGGGADLAAVMRAVERLNASPRVHGVLVQAPLPGGVGLSEVAGVIDPAKDVDGASPSSLGRLVCGLPAFVPATAGAVVELLDHHGVGLAGRRVVVVGRSVVVGRPLAHLLLDRDATVTVCHSRTVGLASVTRDADVLVVAAGRAGLVTAEHVRVGAVVVDVGTNAVADGGVVGDVDAAAVGVRAGGLSPVPGGVGVVTTAVLLRNTVQAAGVR